MSKLCKKCQYEKDEQDFYARTGSPDGLTPWCKTCCKAYQREHWRRRQKEFPRRPDSNTVMTGGIQTDTHRTRLLHSFAYEIEPGRLIRFLDIPDDLTRQQADKLKRLISAYVV